MSGPGRARGGRGPLLFHTPLSDRPNRHLTVLLYDNTVNIIQVQIEKRRLKEYLTSDRVTRR
jgi:hypothetical protein